MNTKEIKQAINLIKQAINEKKENFTQKERNIANKYFDCDEHDLILKRNLTLEERNYIIEKFGNKRKIKKLDYETKAIFYLKMLGTNTTKNLNLNEKKWLMKKMLPERELVIYQEETN